LFFIDAATSSITPARAVDARFAQAGGNGLAGFAEADECDRLFAVWHVCSSHECSFALIMAGSAKNSQRHTSAQAAVSITAPDR
jgi:hypothetical protein